MANFCDRYRQAYFQHNSFAMESNGEVALLRRLSDCNFNSVLDVGANLGNWSSYARELFPEATIHCFEIVPSLQHQLKARFMEQRNIVIHEYGLSDKNSTRTIVVYDDFHDMSNTDAESTIRSLRHSFSEANFVTGAEFLEANYLPGPCFIKIDCEGHDLAVLRGFGRDVKSFDVLQFEFLGPLQLRSPCIQDYLQTLEGFHVGRLLPNGIDFDDLFLPHDSIYMCNYVAIREDRRDLLCAMRRFSRG
jgi:FkbM family methyltransferase